MPVAIVIIDGDLYAHIHTSLRRRLEDAGEV
jgi:hypothetical protein